MLASKIAGIGTYIPKRLITNEYVMELLENESKNFLSTPELAELETRALNLLKKAGCKTRYWCAEDEYCPDIAYYASKNALSSANLDARDIDLIIFTGVTKALIEPATGHILRHKIGATNSNVIDTQDACTSFMKSIDLADSHIKTGKYENILIVCGEVHHALDFKCKTLDDLSWKFGALTLGDCAGAMILQKTEDPVYTENFYHMKSFYELSPNTYDLCYISLNYHLGETNILYSNSSKLFRAAMEAMYKLVTGLKQREGWEEYKYDLLTFHDIGRMLSEEILPHVRNQGIFYIPENFISFFKEYGNVACASLPMAMDIAVKEEKIKRGELVNFLCGAAGVQAGMLSFVY